MPPPAEKSVVVNASAFHIGHPGSVLQPPFDVAVVMPTVLRPGIVRALQSVFSQDLPGRIHVLVGIDKSEQGRDILSDVAQDMPDRCILSVFDLGYSTSARHGGLYPAFDGGALRTSLSYLANSRHVAYLDDDNWWAPNHLSSLRTAIQGKDWAFSLRWFVDPDTSEALCIDQWESVGPGRGAYNKSLGGFVDPNCLMIDKLACDTVLSLWTRPMKDDDTGMSADRRIFGALHRNFQSGETGQASCFYTLNPDDDAHPFRVKWIRSARNKP